jgi:hypothetical protein
MRYILKKLAIIFLATLLPVTAAAFDLGRSGVSLNVPERGWKVEKFADAAIEVWHLRSEQWHPPTAQSGLIAVTISTLEGDPWPDVAALRDSAAQLLRMEILSDLSRDTPFELASGRFQIAGEDFSGAIGLGEGLKTPVSARVLAIRTGDGALLVTAFSVLRDDQEPFRGLFGPQGILTAKGPGSEALNGVPLPSLQPPAAQPQAEPSVRDLLEQMQDSFGETESK